MLVISPINTQILSFSNKNKKMKNINFERLPNNKKLTKSLIESFIPSKPLKITIPAIALASINLINKNEKISGYREYTFIKELSDNEFEQGKRGLKKRIKQEPEIRKKLKNIKINNLNKYNIQFLKTILENDFLLKDAVFSEHLELILAQTSNKDDAEAKMAIIDKYRKNEILRNNKDLEENIGILIFNTHTKETSDAKLRIIDKYINDTNLNTNKDFRASLPEIIDETNNTKIANIKINLLNIIFNNYKLYKNDNVLENLGSIVNSCNSDKIANIKIGIINKYIKDKNLHTKPNIIDNIGNIIGISKTELTLAILNLYTSDENLYKNSNLNENIGDIILLNSSSQNAKEILAFFKKYISSEKFYKNKLLNENIGYVLNNLGTKMMSTMCSIFDTNDSAIAKLRFGVYDLFLKEPLLFENINFTQNLQNILESINTNNDGTTKYHLIYKYLANEKMHNNEYMASTIGDLVKYAKNFNIDLDNILYKLEHHDSKKDFLS